MRRSSIFFVRVVKNSPLIVLIFASVLFWNLLYNYWNASIGSGRSIVSTSGLGAFAWEEADFNTREMDAELEIINFDIQNSEIEAELNISAPRSLPAGFKSVRYRSVVIKYVGLAGSKYDFSESGLFILNDGFLLGGTNELIPVYGKGDSVTMVGILNNYPVQLPARHASYYPFDTHVSDLYFYAEVEYTKENGDKETRYIPIMPEIDSFVQNYDLNPVRAELVRKEDFRTEKILTGHVHLEYTQPLAKKLLFVLVLVSLNIFLILILLIKDLSSMLEVLAAVIIGIWGISNIVSPDEIPYNLRYVSELSILVYYALAGLAVVLWFATRSLNKDDLVETQPVAKSPAIDFIHFAKLARNEVRNTGTILFYGISSGSEKLNIARLSHNRKLKVRAGKYEQRDRVLVVFDERDNPRGMLLNPYAGLCSYGEFQSYLLEFLGTPEFHVKLTQVISDESEVTKFHCKVLLPPPTNESTKDKNVKQITKATRMVKKKQ